MTPSLFYKALSDETRLRCLLLITHLGELCVCELMEALNDTQPKVSRHLAQLRRKGILADRRQKQWVFYSLHPDLPDWARTVLEATVKNQLPWISENIQQLKNMDERPNGLSRCC